MIACIVIIRQTIKCDCIKTDIRHNVMSQCDVKTIQLGAGTCIINGKYNVWGKA